MIRLKQVVFSSCLPPYARIGAGVLLFFFFLPLVAAERFVSYSSGDFLLNDGGKVGIYIDEIDQKGISLAAHNWATDLQKVCGAQVFFTNSEAARIVVGSIGHSKAIDALVKHGDINAEMLRGKCEKYVIQRIGKQLVIAGSDRRGAIYGVYELSRQIGVSPWYDWADVPIEHHNKLYILAGVFSDGEPAVRYRGLFLNDEAPCLTSWVKHTYGTDYGDHHFYARVFELILILKGNMLWPAMWSWAFYTDDAENSKTADEMGIIIGTSHHEPMARNHQEWHAIAEIMVLGTIKQTQKCLINSFERVSSVYVEQRIL